MTCLRAERVERKVAFVASPHAAHVEFNCVGGDTDWSRPETIWALLSKLGFNLLRHGTNH